MKGFYYTMASSYNYYHHNYTLTIELYIADHTKHSFLFVLIVILLSFT